jgi:AraC family transcriptional regulator
MSHVTPLFVSPLLQAADAICTCGRSGILPTRGGPRSYVGLVRRGCFNYHFGSRTYFADSSMALIYDEGAEWQASHPCDCGDDITKFDLDRGTLEEIFGRRRRHEQIARHMSPVVQLEHFRAYATLGGDRSDVLAKEEAALSLLQSVAGQPAIGEPMGAVARRRRRMVDAAKVFLHAHLDRNLDLARIAAEVGCSPYHLMRLFRAETGQSLRGYRARLRVIAALDQLASGAEDLTQVALAVGFASHSHLTDTFRVMLGATPSQLRAEIGDSGLIERRRLLEAGLRTAA